MQAKNVVVFIVMLTSGTLLAQSPECPPARVSFSDYKELVEQVEQHRADRLINLDTFLKMSKEPDTIILDARSESRFERIRIQGARSLPFTEFTHANLGTVIPSMNTRVLIYCNNNFGGEYPDLAIKALISPFQDVSSNDSRRSEGHATARTLALNIPTYITLFGYGYRNVFELNEMVRIDDPRITFEGSRIPDKSLRLS